MSTSLGSHSKDAGEVWPWHRGLSWVFSTARTLAGGVFSLPSHHPLGLGTTCSLTSVSLHYGATHSSSSHPSWEAPTVFQPFQQHRGSAQDDGTCTAAPLPPLSCALHPRSPGDGGPGLCSTAAVPRSQETASINHWHIHPSPDPEMAIPRLGLSPGNPVVSCRVGWEGRGRQGERDMQQGSRGARHGGLAGRGSGTAMGTLAPATHTVGYFKVCHVRAASVPLWANL